MKQASKLDGSNAIEIATALADPKGIAIDATHDSWVDSYSRKIEKASIEVDPRYLHFDRRVHVRRRDEARAGHFRDEAGG